MESAPWRPAADVVKRLGVFHAVSLAPSPDCCVKVDRSIFLVLLCLSLLSGLAGGGRLKAQSRIAQQVERMTNMLQELIEFTKPSGQRLLLRAVNFVLKMNTLADEQTAEELRVEIEDTGRGIAPELVESIFAPFKSHGKAHGIGLGLTICRKIAEDHGGKIWAAASQPGKGATFCFTLPLAAGRP